MTTTTPADHDLPGAGWTLRKLQRFLSQQWNRTIARATLDRVLHGLNLSWKRCARLLGKRDPAKRAAFLERFHTLYQEATNQETILVYIDESHFHRDVGQGSTWAPVGHRVWRVSPCASLSDRINWYGAYNLSDGQCLIWAEGACNTEATLKFLNKVAAWVPADGRRVKVIWDGAPWHRAKRIAKAAADLGLELEQLPSYSPDLNPIEGLWKWMREDVTALRSFASVRALFDACLHFVERINQDALTVSDRLMPRFKLDPKLEELGVSG